MNRRSLMLATGLLAILGTVSALAAVGERGERAGAGWREGARHHGLLRLKSRDADGDGAVTLAEFMKRREDWFARLDTNQDGALDAAEIAAPFKERLAFRDKRMMKRLDQDRDGRISRAEFERPRRERFAARDLDDDGKITAADLPPWKRERALKRGREPITLDSVLERAAERFKALDANGDGFIDAEELAARHADRLEYATRRLLHRLDKDHDGKVTRAELEDQVRRRFAALDLDDNGKIDANDIPPALRRLWTR